MIGLMDCNNFFVSCERLFRPDLTRKPVAVLSSNDGCIVARSQEVKDIGIPMGVPLFQVRDTIQKHGIILFSSNFTLYRDISGRVMHALREEFDDTFVYSIDEAFFTIPEGMEVEDIVKIRSRIMQKTGIPVSFGVAPTKTMAKLANSEAKKGSGVIWHTVDECMEQYPSISCGSVWGIGRQMVKRLETLQIRTVSDFLRMGLSFARNEFGVHGERLYLELTGTNASFSSDLLSPHASIMSTQSFGRKVQARNVLESALGHHVAHIGEKLRKQDLLASRLTIMCAPSRYGSYALRKGVATVMLSEPTNDTGILLSYTKTLLEEIYDQEVDYAKAGAIVGGLVPVSFASESLFGEARKEKRKEIFDVIDTLNERYGRETIRPGIIQNTDVWSARSELRSPSFTTRWSEIPHVKAI